MRLLYAKIYLIYVTAVTKLWFLNFGGVFLDMNYVVNVLSGNALFKGIDPARIEYLISLCRYNMLSLSADTIISSESEPCKSMGFVLDGKVSNCKTSPSGSNVIVKTMVKGEYFAEALVFSSSGECPSTIVAEKSSTVLMISAKDVLIICEEEPVFLRNLLVSLSDKVFMLNKKIKLLSYPSVRQRLASFLLDEMHKHHSSKLTLDKTREELSEYIGVARPSVSRELSKMAEDGLISVSRRSIEILDAEALSSIL